MVDLHKIDKHPGREKAHRITAGESGAVDCSDFKGEDGGEGFLHADTKMGMRPVSKRQYRRGGKVLGVGGQEARSNLGRTPRKAGGGVGSAGAGSEQYMNRDYKEANKQRPKGKDHVGGMKEGGRTGKAGGGPLGGESAVTTPLQAAGAAQTANNAGGVPPNLMNFGPSRPGLLHVKRGGKVEDKGDNWIKGAVKHPGALHKSLGVPEDKKIPEKKLEKAEKSDNPKLAKRARLAETLKGLHRASGGRTKGKTNINIVIASPPQGGQGGPGMGGQPPASPPMVPPPPMPAPPPGGGGGGPPMPGGGAPAGPPPGLPPGLGRASGGRTYPLHTGSGGGKGRKQKIRAYGKNAGETPPGESV